MLKVIDYNFNLHSRKIPGMTRGMSVTYLSGLSYVDCGISCDTFNVIHITNGALLTAQELSDAVDHFRNKNFAFCIWISRENLSSPVEELFRNVSVRLQNTEPGMVLDLTAYQPVPDLPAKHIIIVRTPEEFKDFADVISASGSSTDEKTRKYFELTAEKYLDPSNGISLAVYYDSNKAVSVVELFSSSTETLGLYGFATLSTHRGKGIGSSLFKFTLNKAKEDGFKNVILQASEDGIGIYERYGFRTHTIYYEFA